MKYAIVFVPPPNQYCGKGDDSKLVGTNISSGELKCRVVD